MLEEKIMEFCQENSCKKIVILLENEWQVKDCINWLNEVKSEKIIIALSPFAMYELDKQNVSYKSIGEYYDLLEFFKLGYDNCQKCEDLCAIIDKRIYETCPIISEKKITPALFSFYNLKTLYDSMTLRIFQLSGLIDFEKPDAVFIYETKTFGLKSPDLYFDNRESIYAKLLAMPGWNTNVILLPCTTQIGNIPEPFAKKGSLLREKFIYFLRNHPKFYNLALAVRNNNFKGLRKIAISRKNPVLIFGGCYNWDECMEEFYRIEIGPVFRMCDNLKNWIPTSDDRLLSNVWNELCVDVEFRKFFIMYGINFFPIMKSRLEFLVKKLTPACLNSYKEVSKVLAKRNIKAFLDSTISTCTAHSAAKAAHDANIPVVTWQHGGYGYTSNKMVGYFDLMSSDVHFVFGKGVVNQLEVSARCFNTKIVPVGSASLDILNFQKSSNKIKQKLNFNPNKKNILYVTSCYIENNLYTSGATISKQANQLLDNHFDNLFWSVQRAILDVLGKQTDYNVIIKLHPNLIHRKPPIKSYITEKGYQNCHIVKNECSATDLIPDADVLVVDTIATVILQMFTTSKPVFVYTGCSIIDTNAEKLLKQRAYSYFNLDEFTTSLDTFLSSGDIDVQVDLNNRDFLKMYGTHLDDGKSAERAAKTLKNIIENNNSN